MTRAWNLMLSKPASQALATKSASSNLQHNSLCFIDTSHKLHSIQEHQHFHCRMTNALIAINKRMVLD
jgi:hypothetical protein